MVENFNFVVDCFDKKSAKMCDFSRHSQVSPFKLLCQFSLLTPNFENWFGEEKCFFFFQNKSHIICKGEREEGSVFVRIV